MEKVKTYLIAGLSIVILILLLLQNCKGPKVEEDKGPKPYWFNPNFKTDTIRVPKPFVVKGDSFVYLVPPKIIILYRDTNLSPGVFVKCDKDSLITLVDSLGKELQKIDKKFLTNYPKSFKLIRGLFKSDTLKMDFLKEDGKFQTEIFLTDYRRYKYEYHDNKLRADSIPLEADKVKSKLTNSIFGNGGYMVLTKQPFLSLDYYLRYKKFQLNAEAGFTIQQQPTLLLSGKLGFQIR